MIIVHPDEIAGLVDGENGAGEGRVGLFVRRPVRVGGGGGGGERCGAVGGTADVLPEEVVEEGPEGCLG